MGIGNLAGQAPVGLGWYSAWVAIMATAFGITNIVKFHDPTIGLLWLQWSVLWALFWLVLAIGVTRLTALTGWLTLILSFTTCTIPGYLLLLGEWGHVHTWLVLVVIAATSASCCRSDAEPAQACGPAPAPGRGRGSGLGVLTRPGPRAPNGAGPACPGVGCAGDPRSRICSCTTSRMARLRPRTSRGCAHSLERSPDPYPRSLPLHVTGSAR